MTCCPDYCGLAESDGSHPEDRISVEPVTKAQGTLERINTTSIVFTQLAEAAKGDAPPAKLEEMILELYL